jgi:hypothetical protein
MVPELQRYLSHLRIRLIYAVFISAFASVGVEAVDDSLQAIIISGNLNELRWPNFSPIQSQLASFYESMGGEVVWTRHGFPTAQARAMIAMLQGADAKGLQSEDYDGSRWTGRLSRLRPSIANPTSRDIVAFDVSLTVSSMRYVSALRAGRVDRRVFCFGLSTNDRKCDLEDTEARRVRSADVRMAIEELEPPVPCVSPYDTSAAALSETRRGRGA